MELLRRLEADARATLPEGVYDYVAGGAGDERTLAENEAAWARVWLRPRQLTGAGPADPAVELLGRRLAAPLLLAPLAAQRMLHPEGEPATARAAAAAGLTYCLSTRATTDLAEVAAAAGAAPRWFQLYVPEDREPVTRVLRRAAEHGFDQVVLTADMPVIGGRERELRHPGLELGHGVGLASHEGHAVPGTEKPQAGGWATLGWQDVAWAADSSGLGVVVKGVLTGADAELAVQAGASAVIVSNHGARQLDGSVPTAVALREVAAAVEGRVPVLVDGGVRSGADVVRALALGADAALIGRPFAWALATGGEAGVRALLAALIEDIARTLTLIGAAGPLDVTPDHAQLRGWD